MTTKTSNFHYDIMYMLFKIVKKKIASPKNQHLYLHDRHLALMTPLIWNIKKILYTRLQRDKSHTFVVD